MSAPTREVPVATATEHVETPTTETTRAAAVAPEEATAPGEPNAAVVEETRVKKDAQPVVVEEEREPVVVAPEEEYRDEEPKKEEPKEEKKEETEDVPEPGTEEEMPHAGKLGYGPSYAGTSGIADQLKGTEEKIKGKLFRKPELVKQGEERKAGILAERKHEYDAAHEEGSFEQSQEDAPGAGGAVEKDEVDPSTKANAATAGSKEE